MGYRRTNDGGPKNVHKLSYLLEKFNNVHNL